MDKRKTLAFARQIESSLYNIALVKILNREFVAPLFAVYHITYRCNCHCGFCSREEDIRNRKMYNPTRIQTEAILRRLFELTPSLYITGGEPTLEPDIENTVMMARRIGFWPICVNTNGILLHEHPGLMKYADKLIASLHAGTPEQHASVLGVSVAQGERVFQNILDAAKTAKQFGNSLLVNCVLDTHNVEQAFGVLQFCMANDIQLTVVPAIHEHAPAILKGNSDQLQRYRDFFAEIIRIKGMHPKAIVGTKQQLIHLQNLREFKCRPSVIVNVSPDGNILNPCKHKYCEVPKIIGGIDSPISIDIQMRQRLNRTKPYEMCDGRCLKMCYLGPAQYWDDPWSMLFEI